MLVRQTASYIGLTSLYSADSVISMNKVFGILLAGVFVLALLGTDGAWAGNWNTTKKGFGLNGVYKDEDWSHSFYNNCGFPSKKNVKWHTENEIRFLRFTLKDKQVGTCSSDNKSRSSAPYWERAEIKAGQKGNLFAFNKKRTYQIKFKVRFVSGFTGDRETFLQVHNTSKGCPSSSRPPVMLKFNNGLLEPVYAREDGSGHNRIILKNPIHISNFYSKWLEFTLEYGPSSKKGLAAITLSIDGKIIGGQDKVWQSPCGRPHVKFGIYRGGHKYAPNPTSTIDFDYIKIFKISEANFNKHMKEFQMLKPTIFWQKLAKESDDKEVCNLAAFQIGDRRVWLTKLNPDEEMSRILFEEAKRRGLDCGVKN